MRSHLSRQHGRVRGAGAAVLVALIVATVATSATASTHRHARSAVPRLGRVHTRSQQGFGDVRPATIFLGGDPTGLAQHIHWSSWGGAQATGTGLAEYVWPGTCVGCGNPPTNATVVAFKLGKCHGHPSYNAVDWFFPQYEQHFRPDRYIPTCADAFFHEPPLPPSSNCGNVTLSEGSTAHEVRAAGVSCGEAERIVAESPAGQYQESPGGRFIVSGWRCGTVGNTLGSASYECEAHEDAISFAL